MGGAAAGFRHLRPAAAEHQGYGEVRDLLRQGRPLLLLFGTAWGLAPEVLATVDATLPPIEGSGDYNHLPVRAAVAIILDRLLGKKMTEKF